MANITLFQVGLITMFFFVMSSNIFNYVSIGTNVWAEDTYNSNSSANSYNLWTSCTSSANSYVSRQLCYLSNPKGLIATGTAFNCLALLLSVVVKGLQKSGKNVMLILYATLFSILLSLIFNTTGWYFVFLPQYQNIQAAPPYQDAPTNLMYAFKLGWSFWLMAPSFACDVIAAVIVSALVGCSCMINKDNVQPK